MAVATDKVYAGVWIWLQAQATLDRLTESKRIYSPFHMDNEDK